LNASSRASGRRSRRGAATPQAGPMGRGRRSRAPVSKGPLHGSSAQGSKRRFGVRRAARRYAGDGARRAPARRVRRWKAPGWKPLSRGRWKASVAAWTPGKDPTPGGRGTTTKGVGAWPTGRSRAPAGDRHGRRVPPTSDVTSTVWFLGRVEMKGRLRPVWRAPSSSPGSKRRRFGADGTTRGPKHVGSCPEGRLTLQNSPRSPTPVVRHRAEGARDETNVTGCTREEGKGASGWSSPVVHATGGRQPRPNGSRPEVTSRDPRAEPTDITLCWGPVLQALPHIVGWVRSSATKRQRYAGRGARGGNAPWRLAGPPKRASRRETEGSHIAWDAVRSVPRQRGYPFFGNEIVGSRRRSKGDRGHRRIRSHADAEACSRAAAPSRDGAQGDLARRASSRVKHAGGERGTTVGSGRSGAGASESESGARLRRLTLG
jgi:hypothetical protein